MTDEQKQQIIALRRDGAGYGRIAARLQISINTVKSFCRRHSLAASTAGAVCEQCGKPIEQNPGRKRKRFCCDVCRNKWWNAHLELVKRKAVYTYTCPACGKKFTATAIRSSAPMPAILHTGSEVSAMDKRSFQNETAFQVVMHLARRMLAEKLITGKEYRDFVQEMIRRYPPFSGDLYT